MQKGSGGVASPGSVSIYSNTGFIEINVHVNSSFK